MQQKHANLPGRKFDLGIPSLFGHKLCISPCTACYLRPLARLHLNIVDLGTQGYVAKRQNIAWFNVGSGTGNHRIVYKKLMGSHNIALFPVCIIEQGDAGRSIGIVFY